MPPSANSLLRRSRYNSTHACDSCRSSKSRCKKVDYIEQSTKCSRCTERNFECTYFFQQQKRGPKPSKPLTSPPTSPTSHNAPLPKPPPSNNTPPPTRPPSNNIPFPYNDDVFVNSDDLYDLLHDLYSEGIKPDVNARDLHQEPCPYKNTLGHYCHMG
ncbi:14749_t:CDS:1, partial [Racocetra persica]